MEKPSSSDKRHKLVGSRHIKNKNSAGKTTDSSYGSMKTGTSSNSSLSLSLFSESDLPEAPSTSGCSSEMASMTQSKERKKEKAKEFMKKLKSLLPMKERMGKMDTLATLEQVVNSMRQLNEDQRRDQEFKMPAPYHASYQTVIADKLSESKMYILVSPKNHVVHSVSPALMAHLGYPTDWWKGRLFKDFLNKKDINIVNSCVALHSTEEDNASHADTAAAAFPITSISGNGKESSKYLYARIRRFRKLTEGFNLHNVVSYCPFAMTIATSKPSHTDVEFEEETGKPRKSLTIYCHPLTSAFTDGETLLEDTKFSIRHSPCCKFTYVHPNAVRLLGYLPQDYMDMSIFELFHPDDLQKLLDIHKKIMLSMGQPFKSKSIRFKTRNGLYVEVDTEWSSFVNPWSMKLEFIIGQHTVVKRPSRPDIFEDILHKADKSELSAEGRKIQTKILEVLKKPIQHIQTGPTTSTPLPAMDKVTTSISSPVTGKTPAVAAPSSGDDSVSIKTATETPKVCFQLQGEVVSADSKSTVIDDKGISSIYNQLNYSHNIKRFLMSHPKSFSNVSDEDSMMTRDDEEDDAMNEEEEMPLEIPVVKPPSCGSSTQVHVSEQGHGEDMLSPPTFGDDAVPTHQSTDNIHSLTEESLKKHTKIQERLYLQRISEEQPLLFNSRKVRSTRGSSHQKRPHPSGKDEKLESAKHPCTNGGIFRSSSNIFMQNFPAVTSTDVPQATKNAGEIFGQSVLRPPQAAPIGIFNTGYQTGNQTGLQIPGQPITLVSGDSVGLSYIPTSMGTMVPGQGLVNVGPVRQPQNIQWPYYPQAGYTLLPQVMAGFFRPLLQPLQLQAVVPQQGVYLPSSSGNVLLPQAQVTPSASVTKVAKKGVKYNKCEKTPMELDNPSSSVEDTNSSIMYLLESSGHADSSTCEDADNKGVHLSHHHVRPQKKRTVEPPWLRGVKWDTETKMRYQMPRCNLNPTLEMDNKMMKKFQQNELAQTSLAQLLEEISLPEHQDPFDENADYLFFPGDQSLEAKYAAMKDDYEEVDMTCSLWDDDGGGYPEDDGGEGEIGELGPSDHDDSFDDTPVNTQSEHENEQSTPMGMDDGNEDLMILKDSSEDGNGGKEKSSYERSPKSASLSGDDASGGDELSASDGGQKQETEDSQSSCSKCSSDWTPSENRSNEDVGSSHKESDASSKHLKGVLSVVSSISSNGQSSPEDGSSNPMLIEDCKEIFRKLFVPLKVQVTRKLNTPGLPYWLVQAHLSESVAMTYKVPTRLLEDVLIEDRKKMQDMVQSTTVKQQLLQLLSEVDPPNTTVPLISSNPIMSSCLPATYPGAVPKSLQQATSFASGTRPMTMPAFSMPEDQMNIVATATNAPIMSGYVKTETKDYNRDACVNGEEAAQSSDAKIMRQMFLLRNDVDHTSPKEELASTKQDILNASDTNSDPMVGNSLSSSTSQASQQRTQRKRQIHIPAALPKTADMFFQDWCQAVASGVASQTVEDVIMSKLFVTNDNTSNSDVKMAPNIFGLME